MARTDRLSDQTIGQRVHTIRVAHPGWSLRVVADRAGISKSTLSAIEHGERSVNNRYLLHDLAAALEVSVSDITGQPYLPADRQLEAAHGRVNRVRAALAESGLDEPAEKDFTPRPMPALVELCATLDARRGASDFAAVTDLVSDLVLDLHAHATQGDRLAVQLLLNAYYTAMFTLRNLGYAADAWIAAERCREAAQTLDEPVPLAVAEFVRAHAAAGCIGYRRAGNLVDRAIDGLSPHLGDPTALDVLGMLHLTATHAAMGQKRPDDAFAHLVEAEAIAGRTGETRSWHLWFGPTNVNIWRMGLEVDSGRHGKAVEVARTTQVGGMPTSRQTSFYVDLARGLATEASGHDKAVRALLTAERIAPQRTRSSAPARETARDIAETARRRAVGSGLRGFCERVGVQL